MDWNINLCGSGEGILRRSEEDCEEKLEHTRRSVRIFVRNLTKLQTKSHRIILKDLCSKPLVSASKMSFGTLASVLTLLLSSAGALAYVPPSEFILSTFVRRHSDQKFLRITSQITAFSGGKPTNTRWNEVLFVSPDGMLKSSVTDSSGNRVHALTRNLKNAPLLSQLLFGKDPTAVGVALQGQGIPIKLEAELLALKTESERVAAESGYLKRWNQFLAWVFGGKSDRANDGSPQIWFQKDAFLPIRLIVNTNSDVKELQFEDYRSDFAYPRTISALDKSGEILVQIKLQEIESSSAQAFAKGDFHKGSSEVHLEGSTSHPALEIYSHVLR